MQLRARFEVNTPDSLFLSDSLQKDVPIDGLPFFVEHSWEAIKSRRELNLPDMRVMVVNYRCNEIKEEALMLV